MYKGKRLSYANAHCADGRLQAKAEFSFKNGDFVQGTIFKPCKVTEVSATPTSGATLVSTRVFRRTTMRTRLLAIGALLATGVVLARQAQPGRRTVRVGTLVLHADGGFEPHALPKRAYAPIHFQGFGEIKTTDGSMPPALQHVKLEFDHDGHLTTAGLPVCRPAQLEGATTAAGAPTLRRGDRRHRQARR